jgi:hypothetical protein
MDVAVRGPLLTAAFWVCYLGYVVGLTLLVAAGAYRWTQLVFPVWVLLVSLVILLDRSLGHDRHSALGS